MHLEFVVPCYNEEQVLPLSLKALEAIGDRLLADGAVQKVTITLVDDGSRDRTWEIIETASVGDKVRGIKLSRNFGHQSALLAGLMKSVGDVMISIDADLQDDTEIIPEMVRKAAEGADIVYGVRDDRSSDTAFKRGTARAYYRALAAMGVEIIQDHADFRAMSRRAIETLGQFDEVNLFLRGVVPQLGYKTAIVRYQRKERPAGETKYPISKMLGLAVNGVTSFSATPLRFISLMGILVSLGAVILVLWALHQRLFSDNTLPGWASTFIPIAFLGGLQLLSLGIIGEYVSKIYLETKRRPRFVIEEIKGDAPSAD